MEEELRALLLADSGVIGHVGNRVNWGENPQGWALPAIVLNLISRNEGYSLDGADGISTSRVQVDCYADGYGAALQLGRAVRDMMGGYRAGSFQGIFHAGIRTTRAGGSNAADRPWNFSQDFMIHYNSN